MRVDRKNTMIRDYQMKLEVLSGRIRLTINRTEEKGLCYEILLAEISFG